MHLKEGRVISENPLRLLGVYSDTPKKEIVANLGKLRAFAKTGKRLDFESDYTSLLGPMNRTLETIEKANNDISLPKYKLQAGMFWFMQHTDNDKAAMDCLKKGDPDEAMTILQKKGNYSGIVNMAVLSLILKRWDIALYCYAFLLESNVRRGALVKSFTDAEDYFSEDDLVEFITDKLIQDFPSAHWIDQLQHENIELGEKTYSFKSRFAKSKLLEQLTNKSATYVKKEIDSVLNEASSASRKDAKANLNMADLVESKCKSLLKELRLAFGKENKVYIEYADNIANQILENCIAYYNNDADNPKRARNIIKYTRYAYRTAESKIAKERAKKNLDILNEVLEDMLPESIEEGFNAIDKLVMGYHDANSKIDYSNHLAAIIDEAYSILVSMKNKIQNETENKHYISISSNFVEFAINEIRIKVKSVSNYSSPQEKTIYKSTLLWGRELFDKLAKFKKDNTCTNDYNNMFFSLLAQINKMGVLNTSKTTQIPPKATRIPLGSSQVSSSSTPTSYSHVYSQQKKRKKPSKSDDSSIAYIFAGLGLIGIVVMLLVYVTNNKKDIVETNLQESAYIIDNNSISEKEKEYVVTPETDKVNIIDSETSTSNEEEPETFTTISYSTGDRPYLSTYGKGKYDSNTQNSLLIRNGSSTDAVVFLERTNGKKVRHVFIARGDNYTMTNIPGGQYIVKIMQGTDWNPDKDNGEGNPKGGFMYSCSISKSEPYDPFNYPDPSTGRYSQGEITLYKVQDGNMQTESINENDLF